MGFMPSALLFSLLLLVLAWLFGDAARRWPTLWRTLPRQRTAGALIAVVCLAWAAMYGLPMLEGGAARFRPIIQMLVPVIAILSYFFMSFLFARALGGLILLAVAHLLDAAFAADPPGRVLLAGTCYLLVFAGVVLIAAPWLFRDLLEKSSESVRWRRAAAGLSAACGIIIGAVAIVAL